MMLFMGSRHVSVVFVFAADGLFGNWAGHQRGWGRHLQNQGALEGHAAGEPTEALARLWWCVRTTASTEQAGQGCEPGHAGVQAKALQDKVNWEKDSGGFMVCFLSFYRQYHSQDWHERVSFCFLA